MSFAGESFLESTTPFGITSVYTLRRRMKFFPVCLVRDRFGRVELAKIGFNNGSPNTVKKDYKKASEEVKRKIKKT